MNNTPRANRSTDPVWAAYVAGENAKANRIDPLVGDVGESVIDVAKPVTTSLGETAVSTEVSPNTTTAQE